MKSIYTMMLIAILGIVTTVSAGDNTPVKERLVVKTELIDNHIITKAAELSKILHLNRFTYQEISIATSQLRFSQNVRQLLLLTKPPACSGGFCISTTTWVNSQTFVVCTTCYLLGNPPSEFDCGCITYSIPQ